MSERGRQVFGALVGVAFIVTLVILLGFGRPKAYNPVRYATGSTPSDSNVGIDATVYADPSDPDVVQLEQLRKGLKQSALNYVGVSIDNSQGANPVEVDTVSVTPAGGAAPVTFEAAQTWLDSLPQQLTTTQRSVADLELARLKLGPVGTGQKASQVYVSTQKPAGVGGVSVITAADGPVQLSAQP